MKGDYTQIFEAKVADSLAAPLPLLTRRSVHLPAISGKALAVIGMRRAGKTSFLWQCLELERLADVIILHSCSCFCVRKMPWMMLLVILVRELICGKYEHIFP